MHSTERRALATLPIPPAVRERLLCNGFRTVSDLESLSPPELSKEAGLSHEEALEVMRAAALGGQGVVEARSAKDLLEKQSSRRIVTFCQEMDRILGGGVATSQVTEFCGVPGIGKTQIGIQLCIDVQVPSIVRGLGGAGIFIDTEGSFYVHRCLEMAEAAVEHVQRKSSRPHPQAIEAFTADGILSNIHYFRVLDFVEQLAVINSLPNFINQHPEVRLVVVDSITFHFRHDFEDMAHRTRILAQMSQQLMELAESKDIAIVLMNQVTTKVLDDMESKLVPALGEGWGHCASTRVVLYWQGEQRYAHVFKSPSLPNAVAEYWVTKKGVRGRSATKRSSEGVAIDPDTEGAPEFTAKPTIMCLLMWHLQMGKFGWESLLGGPWICEDVQSGLIALPQLLAQTYSICSIQSSTIHKRTPIVVPNGIQI